MKILLHIGQSKTGTSAIQAFLTLNRERLKENRILYPSVRYRGMPLNLGSHNALADSLLGMSRFPHLTADEYFYEFLDQAEKINADRLILSAEHFFGGEPRIWDLQGEVEYLHRYRDKIECLSQYLTGYDVQILVYLRPQIDWFSSAVSQTVRIERLITEQSVYQSDRQFYEMMKPLLKYADLLDAWKERINPSSFMVVPYIRSALHRQSSVADFLKRAQLDHIQFEYADEEIKVNESLNPEFIEVKKLLNKKRRSKTSERTVIHCLENLSKSDPKPGHYLLDPLVRHDIEIFVSGQNERINRSYISGEVFLTASSKAAGEGESISYIDVINATQLFAAEYRRPKYLLLYWSYALRAILRKHARPIHALLHQAKLFYWSWKYRS